MENHTDGAGNRISIHALLAESDRSARMSGTQRPAFLSTLSLRRATAVPTLQPRHAPNFYPRSPCGERPRQFLRPKNRKNFYPRSPCGERLPTTPPAKRNTAVFLSTLSLRRATCACQTAKNGITISIHALLAESDNSRHYCCLKIGISIHALLAESDLRLKNRQKRHNISIHALLAESDGGKRQDLPLDTHFYPRSPCGERHNADWRWPEYFNHFYPRSPCGERPASDSLSDTSDVISIHALLAESDIRATILEEVTLYFYPRSPCGERPQHKCCGHRSNYFYPRSPCGERLTWQCCAVGPVTISIHALLAESDKPS